MLDLFDELSPEMRFKSLLKRYAGDREGMGDLMNWLEGTTDFYKAPASTRFHGSHEGGLVIHSLAVLDNLLILKDAFGMDFQDDSMVICALLHDVCKADCYKPDFRNVKDDRGQWHRVPCFKFEEKFSYGGHGSKSVFLIQNFVKLSPEEASAINCHMGQFDATTYSNPSPVYSANPLAWMLHVADEAATHIDKL